MDIYVHRSVEVKFTTSEAELWALRDLVKGGEEYFNAEGIPITEVQAKVIGSIMAAIEQVKR